MKQHLSGWKWISIIFHFPFFTRSFAAFVQMLNNLQYKKKKKQHRTEIDFHPPKIHFTMFRTRNVFFSFWSKDNCTLAITSLVVLNVTKGRNRMTKIDNYWLKRRSRLGSSQNNGDENCYKFRRNRSTEQTIVIAAAFIWSFWTY